MKKIYFTTALAALTLASCSEDIGFNTAQDVIEAQQSNAIQFGTYMGQAAQTRAGEVGALTTDKLKASTNGFGVFAYYTGTKPYADGASTAVTDGKTVQVAMMANFMFNQQVKWNGSLGSEYITQWTYSPAKYWPNEVGNGAVDDQDNDTSSDPATTTNLNGGNLSFFAYAPYVGLTSSDWSETEGIVAINGKKKLSDANQEKTDPILTYVVPKNANEIVDLLWGTYGNTSSNVLSGGNAGVSYQASGTNYEKSILPHYLDVGNTSWDGYRLNADLTKQKTNGKVDFAFKHALAKVGGSMDNSTMSSPQHGLMVIADIDDQKGAERGGDKSSATKITITDIQIEARSLYDADNNGELGTNEYLKQVQGDFNLATGRWGVLTTSNTGTSSEAGTTNHNVTSPASSGVTSSATLNATIAEPASPSTIWSSIPDGVTTTAQNVYAAETNPLVFIPGTYPELTITINYTVRSRDANLASGAGKSGEGTWTYVKQVIKKKVTFKNPVELNKQYSLLIHLGLTGVKFTATVSNWDVAGDTNGNGTIESGEELLVEDVHLPINVGGTIYHFISYSAVTGGTEYGKGVAILTGAKKTIGGNNYNEVQIQYNSVDGWAGKTYYVISTATEGSTRYQLYKEDGSTEDIWVALTKFEPKTYKFTSYSTSAADDGDKLSTGTAQTTGLMKKIGTQELCQVRILTNPAYPSWEGCTYYIQSDAAAGSGTAYQLYDENSTIDVWVKITE